MSKLLIVISLILLGILIAKYPKGTWRVTKGILIATGVLNWLLALLDVLGIIDPYTYM